MRKTTILVATLSCIFIAAHSQGSQFQLVPKNVNINGKSLTLFAVGKSGGSSGAKNSLTKAAKKATAFSGKKKTVKPSATAARKGSVPKKSIAKAVKKASIFTPKKKKSRLLMQGRALAGSKAAIPKTDRVDLVANVNVSGDSVTVLDIEMFVSNPQKFLDDLNMNLQKIRKQIIFMREDVKGKNLWKDYFGGRDQTLRQASNFFFPVCLVKRSAGQSVCIVFSIENIYLIYGFVSNSVPSASSSFSGLLRDARSKTLLFFDRRSEPLLSNRKNQVGNLKSGLEPSIYAAMGLFASNLAANPTDLFNNMVSNIKKGSIPSGSYANKSYGVGSADANFNALLFFVDKQKVSAKNVEAIEFWAKLLAESIRNQTYFEKFCRNASSFNIPGGAVPWDANSIYEPYIKAGSKDADKMKNANTKGRHFLIHYTDGLNLISIYK